MGKRQETIAGSRLIQIVDKNNKTLSRGDFLSRLYGRVIPESLADKICYPEEGEHHHLWYKVETIDTDDKNYPLVLELNCACGKKIRYASHQFSELLLQLVQEMKDAKTLRTLKHIKASVPEEVIDEAWKLADESVKKHCYQLVKASQRV